MSTYRTRVSRWHVVGGVAVSIAIVSSLIALMHWLAPVAPSPPPLPAPADADASTPAGPGAVVCPSAGEVPPAPEVVRPSASELIDCPDVYDARTVAYVGEVIEATFPRGDRVVVVLNDDDYALGAGPLPETRTALGGNSGIAVVLPAAAAEHLRHLGDYRHRGDRVEVVGEYDSASELLAGEPAIVAWRATVAEPGYVIPHGVDVRTVVAAAVAMSAAASLAVVDLRRRA